MPFSRTLLAGAALMLGTLAPLHAAPGDAGAAPPSAPPAGAGGYTGVFANPSPLPYHLPPFDRITDADFAPGLDAGMAQQRAEMAAIAGNPAPPTFDNTIVAMERSGQVLQRAGVVFENLSSANTDDQLDKLQAEMAPRLAAHQDAILLDPRLYARVKTLYDARASLNLDPESARLLDRYNTRFVRAGANLSDADKARLKAINEELSTVTNQFRQNVLDATKAAAVPVASAADLKGLPEPGIAAAAEAAKARGLAGKYLLTIQNTTNQPVLASLDNRALRERVYRASITRAGPGSAQDNTPIVARIVALRAERAKLLGYPNYAAYALADETAHDTQSVNDILGQIAPAAFAKARVEAADIQAAIDAEARQKGTPGFTLQPWDWDYYAGKVRKARYAFDDNEVRPYFELTSVLENGVFYAAHRFYGLSFKRRTDLPVYQPDVRVYEVFDADGKPLALFLSDNYKRDSKQGGAWMNSYVDQSRLMGDLPVVANHLNIPKPPDGQPTLLTFDETTTLFHEFGHALHGMLSNVQYPLLSGTATPRDFVEYPSQFNEMWATNPEVLANFAKHYQTGQPIPPELLAKVRAAGTFNEGFATGETVSAMMLDQSWHQLAPGATPPADQVMAFEAQALKANGTDFGPVPPRYHSPYFSHIFSSPTGYAAGYYAYLWTAVLAADSEAWVKAHGGLQRANGDFIRAKVLSRGNTEDARVLFEQFYGRGPDVAPLVEKRGLTLVKAGPAGATAGAAPVTAVMDARTDGDAAPPEPVSGKAHHKGHKAKARAKGHRTHRAKGA